MRSPVRTLRPGVVYLLTLLAVLGPASIGAWGASRLFDDGPRAIRCDPSSSLRTIEVASASALIAAAGAARPGDLILLADGTYRLGSVVAAAVDGSRIAPIVVCGSRAAVIDAGGYGRYAFEVTGDYWIFEGFGVRHAMKAFEFNGANHGVLRGLAIADIGQEAVHFMNFSSDNLIEDSTIRGTGRLMAEYGEGVYVGTWPDNWDKYSGGLVDHSDRNVIRDNTIGPNVTAESVDVKAGTRGTVIANNVFDGHGMVAGVGSWVAIQGNDVAVTGNRGAMAPRDGFTVLVYDNAPAWGYHAIFRGNTADVDGPGYGFHISPASEGTVVSCDNVVSNAASGFATLECADDRHAAEARMVQGNAVAQI